MLFTLGGCSEDDELRTEKCIAMEYIRSGEYVLVNDNDPHPAYAQCIFADSSGQSFGWTWEEIPDAPQQERTDSSVSLLYGEPPVGSPLPLLEEHGGNSPPALPIYVENLASLTIDYDVSVATTSRHSLGFSASDYNWRVGWSRETFLSVVIYSDRSSSASGFQQRVRIDGAEYDFYKSSDEYWSYYRFVMVRPMYSGSLHLHKFLDFLDHQGYGDDPVLGQIDRVEFFQVMWEGGSGRTDINTLSFDVTPNGERDQLKTNTTQNERLSFLKQSPSFGAVHIQT
jgi:hypothetical protein